jgi:uncharacterized protein (DUF2249 family)
MNDNVIDVRTVRKPHKHPTVFAAYGALECGESFVLVNNHDPLHLHEEFESEHPGSYGWDYLETGPRVWRIEIRKLTSAPLPDPERDDDADPSGTDGEDDKVGGERAGRLIAQDQGSGKDEDAELWATDAGIDGAGASAEEAAMHVIDDDDAFNG